MKLSVQVDEWNDAFRGRAFATLFTSCRGVASMSSVILRDGTHAGPNRPPPTTTNNGVGYCRMRSEHYRRRVGHLYNARCTIKGVTTIRCSFCWAKR